LPVTVSEEFLQKIFEETGKEPATELKINLQDQTIRLGSSESAMEVFEINSYKKTCLLKGFDDIDYLLSIKEEVEQFEKANIDL
jgi:3-isopropylmalate/(R)-2-methylmalate dehydratase small subunit